jgi:hypothetical protein
MAAVVAVALACSKSAPTPASPSAPTTVSSDAAADGSTLKATAPTPVSPINGAQPDTLTLTINKSTGKFDSSVVLSYEFEIKNAAGATVCNSGNVPGGTAATIVYTPTCVLEFDTAHTWRARATNAGAVGPWSAAASFKTPSGGYIRNGELFDPLTNGKTVGSVLGSVTFTSEGASINELTSSIRYIMDQTVTAGEYSFYAKNIKSAAPGGKTKMMAIQQGTGDITDNPYRFTVEKRGSAYVTPGQTRYRIITGNNTTKVWDSASVVPNYDTARWYFWKATWTLGSARVQVRLDSDTGPIVADLPVGTGSSPYAPNPMVVYVGAPVGRAGPEDASVPRIIVKNVWLSARSRPAGY